jgi:very-short-patch-repair endonuclease
MVMQGKRKFNVIRGQHIDPKKLLLAKALRRNMTPAERLLWNRLRRSALEALHFHRQQIIVGFIVDFYCAAAQLAVELDGPLHEDREEADFERDRALAELGIRTLRIRNEELAGDFEGVVRRIAAACRGRPKP